MTIKSLSVMPELFLPCTYEFDVSLASRSYYGIGGRARFLAHPGSPAELADLLLWNKEYQLPLAIMGKGSNILFSDSLFPGIVISLDRMQRMFWISDDELWCEAGADNTLIAEELLKSGRGGGAWLYRLPGQIGSTVRMNARCFGGEISAVTRGIQTMTIEGRLQWQTPDEVFHGYKQTSLMDNPEIVVAVLLHFPETGAQEEIKYTMDGYLEERTKSIISIFPAAVRPLRTTMMPVVQAALFLRNSVLKAVVKGELWSASTMPTLFSTKVGQPHQMCLDLPHR